MGEFDSHQAQIEALKSAKAPSELKSTLSGQDEILVGAVNQSEKILEDAYKALKNPKARAHLVNSASEISGKLVAIAHQGFLILREKGKLKSGIESINSISANLSATLSQQKQKIEQYKKYEKDEKDVGDTADKVTAYKKAYDEYKNVESENFKREKAGQEIVPLEDYKLKVLAARENVKIDEGMEARLSSTDADVGALYSKLLNDKFKPSLETYKGLSANVESIEKDFGRDLAMQKMEGIKEALKELEKEEYLYQTEAIFMTENYSTADEGRKAKFLEREQSLLQGYVSARSLVSQIRSDIKSDKIYWINDKDFVGLEKQIKTKISSIEGSRGARKLHKRLSKNEIRKYYTIVFEADGTVKIEPNKYELNKVKTFEEHNQIMLQFKHILGEVRREIKTETQQAELQVELAKGKIGLDQVKEKLGKKGDKYFEGLKKMAAGNKEGAVADFQAYLKQSFSKEEMKLHAGLIAEVKGLVETAGGSATYYEALKISGSGNLREAYAKFNQYIQETNGLSAEQKLLHKDQISASKEALKKIGLSSLNLLDDIRNDVTKLRESQRRLAGAHLHYSESMEVDYLGEEISALRERVISGDCTNLFEEINKTKDRLKKKIAKKVKDINKKYEESMLDQAMVLFDAVQDKDPKVKQKALVAFAKRARSERGYGLARKYLEYAMESEYKKYATMKPPRVDRGNIRKRMLGDPKIMKWLRSSAKERYSAMKKSGNLAGLSKDQIQNRLLDFKLDEIYRAELRRQMTLDGQAGKAYQHVAKDSFGSTATEFAIALNKTPLIQEVDSIGNEALFLHQEYFKGGESDWYDVRTWGASDWDDFEDGCIEFAFETAMSAGIGAGAGAAGSRVGMAVVKRLARMGMKKAAIESVKRGGMAALKTVLRRNAARAVKFAVKHKKIISKGASIAAEGATMFALGTIQSGIMDAKGTAARFSSISDGGIFLGEAIVKAAAYRVIGGIGGRFLGRNPGLLKRGAEHLLSGVAGSGVEAVGMAARGQRMTMKDFAYNMIQDAVQAAGVKGGRGAGNRRRKADIAAKKVAAIHDLGKIGIKSPDEVGAVIARQVRQPDGVVLTEYVIQGKKGKRILGPDSIAALPKAYREKINILAAKPKARPKSEVKSEPKIKPEPKAKPELEVKPVKESLDLDSPEIRISDEYINEMITRKDGVNKLLEQIGNGECMLTSNFANKLMQDANGIDRLKQFLENPKVELDPNIDRHALEVDMSFEHPIDMTKLLDRVFDGDFPLTDHLINKLIVNEKGIKHLESYLMDNAKTKFADGVNKNALNNIISRMKQGRADFKNLHKLRGTSTDNTQFNRSLVTAIEAIKAGKVPKAGDQIGNIFQRLAENDPALFKALANGDVARIVNSECLDAIIKGKKEVFTDSNGNKVEAYIGSHIAEGGIGTVNHVAYIDSSGVLRHAAIKKAHDHTKEYFPLEVSAAIAMKNWDHPNVLKSLKIGDEYIIYETGEIAMDMREAQNRMNASDYYNAHLAYLDGTMYFHNKGTFHGDLKGANCIILINKGPDGKPVMTVKIIDNNPIDMHGQAAKAGLFAWTPAFSMGHVWFEYTSGRKTLEGVAKKDVPAWLGRAWDAHSHGIMLTESLQHYKDNIPGLSKSDKIALKMYTDQVIKYSDELAKSIGEKGQAPIQTPKFKNKELNNIVSLVADSLNPVKSGHPDFFPNLRSSMKQFSAMMKNRTTIRPKLKSIGAPPSGDAPTVFLSPLGDAPTVLSERNPKRKTNPYKFTKAPAGSPRKTAPYKFPKAPAGAPKKPPSSRKRIKGSQKKTQNDTRKKAS